MANVDSIYGGNDGKTKGISRVAQVDFGSLN